MYGFLIVAVRSIDSCCVLWLGGQMASIWSEPRVPGLPLHTIASLVNGLLLALVVGALLGSGRSRRARVVTGINALLVSLGARVTLSVWQDRVSTVHRI